MVTSGSYGACEACRRNYDGGCPYDHDEDVQFDRDGKGPRKGSYMWKKGRRGKKKGHKQGKCK